MKRLSVLLLIVIVFLGGLYVWNRMGAFTVSPLPNADIANSAEHGKDDGRGNLVGIQPYMQVADYASTETFYAKMDAYFRAVREKGWLKPNTVVVLPEYLGTWLVTEQEVRAVYEADTVKEAMAWLAVSHLGSFVKEAAAAPVNDRVKYALFRVKSNAMAETYNAVFSQLAINYHVTIVAGSIILADPAIREGKLVSRDGPLYNVSPVFGPDGRVEALVLKSHPISTEQPFIQAAPVEDLAAVNTPAGKIGVLICADAWFPECYEVMKQKGAEAVVVPKYTTGDGMMNSLWDGYSGYPNPADVDASDLNAITLGQAWDKYALAGRLPAQGIRYGMVVSLRGKLWDLGSDGSCTAVADGQVFTTPVVNGASIINLWL